MSDDKPSEAGMDHEEERIRRKAYHLLRLSEARPEGRNRDHWELAREFVAIEDSQKMTLQPRPADDTEPAEPP